MHDLHLQQHAHKGEMSLCNACNMWNSNKFVILRVESFVILVPFQIYLPLLPNWTTVNARCSKSPERWPWHFPSISHAELRSILLLSCASVNPMTIIPCIIQCMLRLHRRSALPYRPALSEHPPPFLIIFSDISPFVTRCFWYYGRLTAGNHWCAIYLSLDSAVGLNVHENKSFHVSPHTV